MTRLGRDNRSEPTGFCESKRSYLSSGVQSEQNVPVRADIWGLLSQLQSRFIRPEFLQIINERSRMEQEGLPIKIMALRAGFVTSAQIHSRKRQRKVTSSQWCLRSLHELSDGIDGDDTLVVTYDKIEACLIAIDRLGMNDPGLTIL